MRGPQASAEGTTDDLTCDRLLSDAEFQEKLDAFLGSPAASGYAVRLTVQAAKGELVLAHYATGGPPGTDPSQSRTLFEDGTPRAVTCRCELWRLASNSGPRANPNQLIEALAERIDRHWGDRCPVTLLPSLKSATGPGRFAAAVRGYAERGCAAAVLHTDLDNFKAINTDLGEAVGDQALREFATRFREAFGDLGVAVRTAGDEFSAILDGDDVGRVVLAADGFRRRMASDPIEAIGRINTCSIGLCLYPDSERFYGVAEETPVLEGARAAEVRAKAQKNQIALVGPAPAPLAARPIDADDLREAAIRARAAIQGRHVVSSASLISAVRARLIESFASSEDLSAPIAQVRDEFGLLIGKFDAAADRPAELQGILDSLEWAGLVLGALLAATFDHGCPLRPTDELALATDASGGLALAVGGTLIPLDCQVACAGALRAEIGAPLFLAGREPPGGIGRLAKSDASADHDSLSPVLLLPIGDAAKAVADELRSLVAAVVDVDDRPTRGGGLPDFWQSNLSRVIRACLANPNIETVVTVGDANNAKLTMERLQTLSSPRISELERRLSMTADELTMFINRDLSVTTVAAERAAVLAQIEETIVGLGPLVFEDRLAIGPRARSRRRLAIGAPDQTHRLAITDGLRTATLADAYPEALQLIRGTTTGFDYAEPQRGALRELTCFKVVLTDPLRDRIPDYWLEDGDRLSEYYETNFQDVSGLFGRRLLRPFDEATIRMVDFAVGQAADATSRRVPTRRINLPILPQTLDHPLGLSSIQIMPRMGDGSGTLDAIFVWRTVDALVGFPFSAFGSIRWVEDFLAKVNKELSARNAPVQLKMGTLTYIALSFHMYLHDDDIEIARTIVQDASQ